MHVVDGQAGQRRQGPDFIVQLCDLALAAVDALGRELFELADLWGEGLGLRQTKIECAQFGAGKNGIEVSKGFAGGQGQMFQIL